MAAGDNPNINIPARSGTVGTATTFDSGTYSTSGMMYPSDLMKGGENPYGGNYVIFYINVHEDSFLAKNGSTNFVDSGSVAPRMSGDAATLSSFGVGSAAVVTGAVAGSASGVAGKVTKFVGGDLKEGADKIASGTAGVALSAAAIAAVGGPKAEYKRQTKAIALYVPNDVSIKYGVQWEEEGTAGAQVLAAGAENLAKMASFNPATMASGVAGAAGAGINYATGLALQTPGAGQLLGKTSGTAANPKKEQLFKQVDFRTFSFNYMFFPRSAAEAANVRSIIKEFKLHMHPEFRDANHFLYIYPSEFDIFYYQNGKENLNLHRHTSCVLTDMSVMYSPQGIFTTFEDGMPTQVNVTLTFKELALLSKEAIVDGY